MFFESSPAWNFIKFAFASKSRAKYCVNVRGPKMWVYLLSLNFSLLPIVRWGVSDRVRRNKNESLDGRGKHFQLMEKINCELALCWWKKWSAFPLFLCNYVALAVSGNSGSVSVCSACLWGSFTSIFIICKSFLRLEKGKKTVYWKENALTLAHQSTPARINILESGKAVDDEVRDWKMGRMSKTWGGKS